MKVSYSLVWGLGNKVQRVFTGLTKYWVGAGERGHAVGAKE